MQMPETRLLLLPRMPLLLLPHANQSSLVANLSSFNFHLASCHVNDVVDNTQERVSSLWADWNAVILLAASSSVAAAPAASAATPAVGYPLHLPFAICHLPFALTRPDKLCPSWHRAYASWAAQRSAAHLPKCAVCRGF